MQSYPRCDETAAWLALEEHYVLSIVGMDLAAMFQRNPRRIEDFTFMQPGFYVDLSKNLWDATALKLLLRVARECGLEAQRDAMFKGQPVNGTEGLPALHTALRVPRGAGEHGDRMNDALDRMLEFATLVRDTATSGIRDIVVIGIGGSHLGPQMAVQALEDPERLGLKFHFISNVDTHGITPLLRTLAPQRTLFIVASKTFSTQETMANATTALRWFREQGGTDVGRHFVATTTNKAGAEAHGITRAFGFEDSVCGRYSMWGPIGLPIAIAVGAEGFREMLTGAHAMDQHFAKAQLERNLPVLLGMLDVWNRNFHRFSTQYVLPYHHGLGGLVPHLQQLVMESNGKRVDRQGRLVPFGTAPALLGVPGTDWQHSFGQWLHQGTDVAATEFIAVKTPTHGEEAQHRMTLANCFAQGRALMLGQPAAEAHRACPGNRPSTTLLLDSLSPEMLGKLVALYEHRTFVSAALWSINPFDQYGVRLGKELCEDLLPRFGDGDAFSLDPSTAGLLRQALA